MFFLKKPSLVLTAVLLRSEGIPGILVLWLILEEVAQTKISRGCFPHSQRTIESGGGGRGGIAHCLVENLFVERFYAFLWPSLDLLSMPSVVGGGGGEKGLGVSWIWGLSGQPKKKPGASHLEAS